MDFIRIRAPGLEHNSYLLGTNGIGIVIDPKRDIDDYLSLAHEKGLSIRYAFDTHRQEDIVMGSAHLKWTIDAKIVTGQHGNFAHSDIQLADGQTIGIGDLTFVALRTPGHTPESTSYAAYQNSRPNRAWAVFSGDTLVFGDSGRTDLQDPKRAAENAALIYDSIHAKILPLGDQTLLYPAHGAGSICAGRFADFDNSTIGYERSYNPVFTMSRQDFISHKRNERLPRPPYFTLMEKVNLAGGNLIERSPASVRGLQAYEFRSEAARGTIIDTRNPEAFASGHIPNSYNIGLDGLPRFAGWIADHKTPIYLVLENPTDIETAFLHLKRIGLDNIQGILSGGFPAWRVTGLPIESSGTLTPEEYEKIKRRWPLLDVRQISEFEYDGHIEGAYHVYVGYLEKSLANVEAQFKKNEPLVVTCGVGTRTSLAVSILKRHGFMDVFNLQGGMKAWKSLGLPTVTGADEHKTLDKRAMAQQMTLS